MTTQTEKIHGGCCLIWIVLGFLFSFWTDSNLGWALSEWKGETVDPSWWISGLLSIFFGPATLLFNIVCEIMQSA